MQRFVHEDSSKPWWGPQCGSPESLQPPKRAFKKEGSHSTRTQDKPDAVPSPVASPTPWHTVRTWGKNQAEQHDVTGFVRSRVTRSGRGASWEAEYAALANEIKVRHYSLRTLNTYKGWVRKFQAFTKSKQPLSLSIDDVKAFLTFPGGQAQGIVIYAKPGVQCVSVFLPTCSWQGVLSSGRRCQGKTQTLCPRGAVPRGNRHYLGASCAPV